MASDEQPPPGEEPTIEQAVPPAPVPTSIDTAPTPEPRKRHTGRWLAFGALGLVLLAAAGVGGFFAGQSTRKSDEQVASEQQVAVKRAVTAAVAKKGAEDKAKRLRIMHRAATRMNAKHRAEVRKLRQAAARRADQAYSTGNSVGRAAGYNEGVGDGITKASDDLTCSDDPDVPLPYCYDW